MRRPEDVVGRLAVESLMSEGFAIAPADLNKWLAMERVMSCLLDHYLTDYGQNDGQVADGLRDALSAEAIDLVPNWRDRRNEWEPRQEAPRKEARHG